LLIVKRGVQHLVTDDYAMQASLGAPVVDWHVWVIE